MFHRLERNVANYLNFGQLLRALNTVEKDLIRQIENTLKKLNNAEVALAFNLFRTELVERQIQDKREIIKQLKKTVQEQKRKWDEADVIQDLRQAIDEKLKKLNTQHRKGVEARNISKLTRLYGGNIKLPQPRNAFINLVPGLELTEDQEELLNLGLNCHFMTRPRPHRKRLDDIKNLEKAKKITTADNLPADILPEVEKTGGSFQSQILQRRHLIVAKQLRKKEDIVIRRTDKTAAIAIVTRDECLAKMDAILQDTSKFKKITRNPTENIKKEINATINAINGIPSIPKFTKLTGEFSPGLR
ncbi:hypothetical protein E2C01_034962 [Portunus trituberculatus]|uniref:Uncharacterized protein n=1 Tax=Portunus trituberculatus TaxID=210409 RepID=A0A5B7F8F7_PORTR|nr:hypothetical protein [Portunus trituberculatus]